MFQGVLGKLYVISLLASLYIVRLNRNPFLRSHVTFSRRNGRAELNASRKRNHGMPSLSFDFRTANARSRRGSVSLRFRDEPGDADGEGDYEFAGVRHSNFRFLASLYLYSSTLR